MKKLKQFWEYVKQLIKDGLDRYYQIEKENKL